MKTTNRLLQKAAELFRETSKFAMAAVMGGLIVLTGSYVLGAWSGTTPHKENFAEGGILDETDWNELAKDVNMLKKIFAPTASGGQPELIYTKPHSLTFDHTTNQNQSDMKPPKGSSTAKCETGDILLSCGFEELWNYPTCDPIANSFVNYFMFSRVHGIEITHDLGIAVLMEDNECRIWLRGRVPCYGEDHSFKLLARCLRITP